MDCSFKAQVIAVFDTDGQIHPIRFKFRNMIGEIITVQNLTVVQENSKNDKISRSFLCTAYMWNRKQEFCLIYHITFHNWTVEYRSTEDGYRYLFS